MDKFEKLTQSDFARIPASEISDQEALVKNPVVTVLMMTRNHEQYIRQAVDSVLAQKGASSFEILIGEDYSNDQTLEVCLELQSTYPTLIRVVHADRNVGITPNFLRLVHRARGTYIALLEGDDYWIDDLKLEKQVRLMETNLQFSWCGSKTVNRTFWVKEKESYSLRDTLRRYILHTSSIMFRKNIFSTYPFFPDVVGWISMVYAYLAQHGACGFLDEETSYYRHHEGGLWTGKDSLERLRLTWVFTDTMNAYFKHQYEKELMDRELWICGIETSIQLDFWNITHWLSSLRIVFHEFKRTFLVVPHLWLALLARTTIQPLQYFYLSARRVLALRSKLRKLMNKLRGTK